MNLEELLELDFEDPIKAHLVQKAVLAGYRVPEKHLKKGCDFYESKRDFFVAADLALALGEKQRRAQFLRQAASTLIKTRAERDLELDIELDDKKKIHHRRMDYSPIQEGNAFFGGMIMIDRAGARVDFGQLARDHLAEKGTSFEQLHVDAIRCVLHGNIEEAKRQYEHILDRAQRATARSRGIIPTGTLKLEEEMSFALEIGDFERAFEIFERHGINHYGGILARHLGDEERAVELFDKQIRTTIAPRRRGYVIKGVKVGTEVNYGHAAAVAEAKGDFAEVIVLLAQGNNYDRLQQIAAEKPELRTEIEEKVQEIRDLYVNHASGLSINSPQLKLRDGFNIWKEYGLSSLELMGNTLKSRVRPVQNHIGYVSEDKKDWLSSARIMTHIAAAISQWLGEQEKARTLHLVAYKLAEARNDVAGMADDAVKLNERELLETVLDKLAQEKETDYAKTPRRNVLVALGRFDEALATAQKYEKREILEKAERWEELCTGFERGEFDSYQTGNGKIEAYTIAAEHGLQQRADQLYSTLVRERKRARDKFGFYDLVGIIIQRNDRETAQEVIQKARAELFSCQEIDDYEARRLKDMAVLAHFTNDTQAEEIFTLVSELYYLEDPLTMHKPEGERIPKTWEREVMLPLRRYEKYVKTEN